MRDTFGLTLLSLGVHPANATVDDVKRAQAKLLAANAKGQFRGYYGNEYYQPLSNGDLAISIAWSGDISQMNLYDNPDVKFVIPDGGGMRWNDNLAIPKGAAQIDNAHKLLNYWYDAAAATVLSEYIGYFTPVKGVSEQIKADADAARAGGAGASPDPATADTYLALAPTVVPSPDQLAGTYPDKQLSEEEEAAWNDLWLTVRGG
jgi:spermidine/putrescine transport system substrate-binding protein